tara:strand:- start:161 stop:499 length:339 start_codon:yes stop_codon:yes gene_type:complete
MKIHIWIKKEEVLSGKITEYHSTVPNSRHQEFFCISITQDEFARLEDEKHDNWLVDQYNRNRLTDEQIADVDQIDPLSGKTGRSHENYIYERNKNVIRSRKSGDYGNEKIID